MFEITLQNLGPIAGKLMISSYRFLIFILFFLIILKKSEDIFIKNIVISVVFYFIFKTCFHTYFNIAETRYTLPVITLMEIVVYIKLLRLNYTRIR